MNKEQIKELKTAAKRAYVPGGGKGYVFDVPYLDQANPEAILWLIERLEVLHHQVHLEAAKRLNREARIDMLMLEYCPEEMTEEQKASWAEHQGPYEDEPESKSLNKEQIKALREASEEWDGIRPGKRRALVDSLIEAADATAKKDVVSP